MFSNLSWTLFLFDSRGWVVGCATRIHRPTESQASASLEGCQVVGGARPSACDGAAGSTDGDGGRHIDGGSLSIGSKMGSSRHDPAAHVVTSEATSGWTRRFVFILLVQRIDLVIR